MLNIQKFNVDGVMYFSTKTPLSIDDKTIALNFQSGASWISKAIAYPLLMYKTLVFQKQLMKSLGFPYQSMWVCTKID